MIAATLAGFTVTSHDHDADTFLVSHPRTSGGQQVTEVYRTDLEDFHAALDALLWGDDPDPRWNPDGGDC